MVQCLQPRWRFEGAKQAKTKAQHIHNEFIRTNYTFFVFCCFFFSSFRSSFRWSKVKCLEDWLIRHFPIYGMKTRNDCVSLVFFSLHFAIFRSFYSADKKYRIFANDLIFHFSLAEDGRTLKAANCWSPMFRFNFNTYKIE